MDRWIRLLKLDKIQSMIMEKSSPKWSLSVLIVVIIVGVAAYLRYNKGYVWYKGTGFEGKTAWDWMGLILIPIVLAGGAIWFNWSTRKADREAESDRRREATLHNYLDKMTELLLEKGLRKSPEDSEVRTVARARTLTALEGLGGYRKGLLIKFLYEAGLIWREPIIDLYQANLWEIEFEQSHLKDIYLRQADLMGASITDSNLSNADLHNVGLIFADLSETNLSNADLGSAYIAGAILKKAVMREANLSKAELPATDLTDADLTDANLTYADLTDADLTGVDLTDADLTGATVTDEQLAKAKSLKGATMPDGTVHE